MKKVVTNMFAPGEVWRDTDGEPIHAHGGGVFYERGRYYWFGENKDGPTTEGPLRRVDAIGVSCYSSSDLYRWRNEGLVLSAVEGHPDLDPSGVIERPKVIPASGKYVMWLHIDHADYAYARTGVAVADGPLGPYRFLGSFSPGGNDSRDMTVFAEDGRSYLVFSSDSNQTLKVASLADDALGVREPVSSHFVGKSREAPALFKHAGRYYLITSGCSGWAPNAAEYAVAPSLHGPWETRGNPCVGPGAQKTFGAQTTFVLPVAGREGAFIVMMDRWNEDDLKDSRHVWLPAELRDGELSITWYDRWDLSVFDGRQE